jgi:ribosomal protein S18 acetylase RimI-like enzyme
VVRFLSNLFQHTRPPEGPILLRPAFRAELQECVRLVLSTPARRADDAHVFAFIESARARKFDLAALTVAEQGGTIVWAALPLSFPGRTAMVLSAPVTPVQFPAAEMVLRHVIAEHDRLGTRLVQALLDPADSPARGFYEACGFHRLAELIYLEAKARELEVALPPGFELASYSEALHDDFAAAVNASYEATLDCPGLEGVRATEEVIAGHKAAGAFCPDYWFLLREGGAPVGVLLLAPMPPSDAMEIVYIGLAVRARRRGVADPLMRLAFTTARRAGCHRLTTAVDARNTPAMRMYLRQGMERINSREAMLRILHPYAPKHPPVIPSGAVGRG